MTQDTTHQPLFDRPRATRLMERAGIDLVLGSRRATVAYLCDAFAILYWQYPQVAHALDVEDDGSELPYYFAGLPRDPAKPQFAVSHDSRASEFRNKPWLPDVRGVAWRPGATSPLDAVVDAVETRGLGGGAIGVELRHLGAAFYEDLRGRLPRARFVDAGPLLWTMRSVKTPIEIARQRHAYTLGERVYRAVFDMLASEKNVTVGDVRAKQMALATRWGCPPLIFGYVHPFSADGRKTPWSTPHVHDLPIDPGDTLMLDLGLVWRGYTTDFGRAATVGPARRDVREFWEKLRRLREATAAAVRPGVPANEVQRAARRERERLGLAAPESVGAGHSLGIECHERPQFVPNDPTPLEANMTMVIEHCDGFAGVTMLLEDAGVVSDRGWESLTAMGTELVEIGV